MDSLSSKVRQAVCFLLDFGAQWRFHRQCTIVLRRINAFTREKVPNFSIPAVLKLTKSNFLSPAGLLRSKNTQSIIMQVLAGMVVLGFMWDIVGYSLTFGDDHAGIIGDFKHAFLLNVPYNECSPHAPNIPAALYALFMMMFAAITPLLMTGTCSTLPSSASPKHSHFWTANFVPSLLSLIFVLALPQAPSLKESTGPHSSSSSFPGKSSSTTHWPTGLYAHSISPYRGQILYISTPIS